MGQRDLDPFDAYVARTVLTHADHGLIEGHVALTPLPASGRRRTGLAQRALRRWRRLGSRLLSRALLTRLSPLLLLWRHVRFSTSGGRIGFPTRVRLRTASRIMCCQFSAGTFVPSTDIKPDEQEPASYLEFVGSPPRA